MPTERKFLEKLRVVVSRAETGEVTEICEIDVSDHISTGHKIVDLVCNLHETEEKDSDKISGS